MITGLKNEESVDTTRKNDKEESVDLSGMPPLEGDEEVKTQTSFQHY